MIKKTEAWADGYGEYFETEHEAEQSAYRKEVSVLIDGVRKAYMNEWEPEGLSREEVLKRFWKNPYPGYLLLKEFYEDE